MSSQLVLSWQCRVIDVDTRSSKRWAKQYCLNIVYKRRSVRLKSRLLRNVRLKNVKRITRKEVCIFKHARVNLSDSKKSRSKNSYTSLQTYMHTLIFVDWSSSNGPYPTYNDDQHVRRLDKTSDTGKYSDDIWCLSTHPLCWIQRSSGWTLDRYNSWGTLYYAYEETIRWNDNDTSDTWCYFWAHPRP